MTLGSAWHQKSGRPERTAAKVGESHFGAVSDEAPTAGHRQEGSGRDDLLQQVLSRENMLAAWKRVKANKGSAGVDGLTIEQTAEHLKVRWPQVREEILAGTYRPQAVRRVEIPKLTGGMRELGIPTVVS